MVYTEISYDVPTRVAWLNPKRAWRRFCAWTQKSVCVCCKDRIPHNSIAEMLAGGCTVDTLDYAPYEGDKVLEKVRRSLEDEVQRIVASLETSTGALNHAADTNSVGPARDLFRKKTMAALGQARRLLRDCEGALKTFGIASLRGTLGGAFASVQARRIEMEDRCRRYNQMTVALGQLPGNVAAGLAQEARADILPAGIGADFLQDEGLTEHMRRVGAETAAAFQGQL